MIPLIIGGVLGLISVFDVVDGILKDLEIPVGDSYAIRMENGDIQDASGNPPSVILTDLSNTEFTGVFEGTSTEPDERCRNNKLLKKRAIFSSGHKKHLRKRFFGSRKRKLFNGLKRGEAPTQTFRTTNGFNLKSVDILAGSNPICLSNIIFKASNTQGRRDEIILPVGDLGYQCGYQWNWGANLGNQRQRCVWLNGNLLEANKQIKTLHLDMQNIQGFFSPDKVQALKNISVDTLCSFIGDSSDVVTNINHCQRADPERLKPESVRNEEAPVLNVFASNFSSTGISLENFAGSGFITLDNKIYNSQTKQFDSIQENGNTDTADSSSNAEGQADENTHDSASSLDAQVPAVDPLAGAPPAADPLAGAPPAVAPLAGAPLAAPLLAADPLAADPLAAAPPAAAPLAAAPLAAAPLAAAQGQTVEELKVRSINSSENKK